MGNDANSIHQESTSPQVTQSKTLSTVLSCLPESRTNQHIVSFESDTKQNLSKSKSIPVKHSRWWNCVPDTEKDEKEDNEKLAKSNSSRGSTGKFTGSSFEDSSSIVPIVRMGKNCKLMAPSMSPSRKHWKITDFEKQHVGKPKWKVNIGAIGERSKAKDISEYSPGNQRKQSYGKIGNYWLNPKDELRANGSFDLFSIGDPGNLKNPYVSDFHDSGRRSSALSEVSGSSMPFNTSSSGKRPVSNSNVHRVSDSACASWPLGAPPDECFKHLNCFNYGKNTGFEGALPQHEYKKQTPWINFTSKFLNNSPSLEVEPGNIEFSNAIVQEVRPHRVEQKLQIPSIRVD